MAACSVCYNSHAKQPESYSPTRFPDDFRNKSAPNSSTTDDKNSQSVKISETNLEILSGIARPIFSSLSSAIGAILENWAPLLIPFIRLLASLSILCANHLQPDRETPLKIWHCWMAASLKSLHRRGMEHMGREHVQSIQHIRTYSYKVRSRSWISGGEIGGSRRRR